VPHLDFPGNRGNSVIFLDRLDARCLGGLIAMYEHSTAVQGWLHGINSFDQFGVELGKVLALDFHEWILGKRPMPDETLTHPLLRWFVERRKNF
jgi:glucose-6-phosphate isomerase